MNIFNNTDDNKYISFEFGAYTEINNYCTVFSYLQPRSFKDNNLPCVIKCVSSPITPVCYAHRCVGRTKIDIMKTGS